MTPYQAAIAQLIAANKRDKTTVGKLTITYTPATPATPAILAYGRPRESGLLTRAEDLGIRDALLELGIKDFRRKNNARAEVRNNRVWNVARYELPTVGQPTLIPTPEVNP